MGIVDKLKASAEQTANKARETAQDVQTKRELNQAYGDLGKTAFALTEGGDITHADLTAGVDHIKELQSRLQGPAGEGDGS